MDSVKHVPGFIEKAEEFKAKGVSEIILIAGMIFTITVAQFSFSLHFC